MLYPKTSRFALLLFGISVLASCQKDAPIQTPYKGFPVEVGQIFIDNCALSGCHTDQMFAAEGRLSLESWESAFRGSRAGAAIVPYSDLYSYLMYFINQDTSNGIPVQTPSMPFNLPALTSQEVETIRQWIADGAPDIHGNIKWSNAEEKIFVLNQGCDNVAVLDRETGLVMRYATVGQQPGAIESPHYIKMSPDGKYFYTVYINGSTIDKYSTSDHSYLGSVNITSGSWNTLSISPDGKWAFAVSYNSTSGKVALANLETMTTPMSPVTLPGAHGSCPNLDFTKLYVTNQDGNELYRFKFIDPANPTDLDFIDLVQGVPPSATPLGPHEVLYLPGGDKFAVSCQNANEVRIYTDAEPETLLAVIPVGDQPVEMAVSPSRKYLFVTCMEDVSSWGGEPGKRGSVAVIDYETMTLVETIYTGHQPHGIAVDDEKGLVYVANRNFNVGGPAPHHSPVCGQRNGTLVAIDMNTLALKPGFKAEVSADPYGVALKK